MVLLQIGVIIGVMKPMKSKTTIRTRRRKGDGGLYEESGQWCAEWHDSENRRHRAYGATPELALARKAKRIQVAFIRPPKPKQKRGSIGTSNPTVRQAMETWLLNNEHIGEVSRGKYRRNLERYVIPYIGNRAVKRLTPDDMETLKTTWKQQQAGQSAMWHVWKTLNTMLNAMVKKGTIKSNPMLQVDAPKRTNRRAEHIEAYIDDHTQTALGIIAWTAKEDTPYHRYHALVMAMALGLRRAEALGITQAALLPASETLEIRTRLKQKVGGGYYLQPATKNGHYRTIRLPHMHYMALATARRENAITLPIQDEDGARIGEGKMLLTREDGKNYTYNDWGEIWREIQTAYKKHIWGEDAKLEIDDYIIPHEMRHITSSILGEQGESMKTVQSILGHMTPEMTEHYTHLLESGKIETAERWNTNLESMAEFISSTMEEVAKAKSDSDDKNVVSRPTTRKQEKQINDNQ
jgi:site-specific recombinase XerD